MKTLVGSKESELVYVTIRATTRVCSIVLRLFLLGLHVNGPVLDAVALPCLRILQGIIKPDLSSFRKPKVQFFCK